MAGFSNKDALRRKLTAISPAARASLRPVFASGAQSITALQRELVRVEKPPGAHAHGSKKEAAHGSGTEKLSIAWSWHGSKIVISAISSVLPNLGYWLEYGTRAGTRGGSYRAQLRDKHGRLRNHFSPRKQYRTHPGVKPYPFFWSPVRAYVPDLIAAVKRAWEGSLNAVRTS